MPSTLSAKHDWLILFVLFWYLPIETIMHGLGLAQLPPAYYFITALAAFGTLHLFMTIPRHHFAFIIDGAMAFLATLLMLLLMIFSRLFGAIEYIEPELFESHLVLFASYALLGFILARHIHTIGQKLVEYKVIVTISFFLFLGAYCFLLLWSNDFNPTASFLGFPVQKRVHNLHIVTSSLIALFLLWQMHYSRVASLSYFLIGLLTLFTLGSRSALAFFILAGFVQLYQSFGATRYLFFGGAVIVLLYLNIDSIVTFLEQRERMHSLFTLNIKDGSLLEREQQVLNNMAFIKEHLMLGRVMSEILVDQKGSYIHSYLSYLQSYGIVVFALLNLMIIKTGYHLFRRIRSREHFFRFMSVAYLFCLCEFLFSRSYVTYHLFTLMIIFEVYFCRYDRYADKSAQEEVFNG